MLEISKKKRDELCIYTHYLNEPKEILDYCERDYHKPILEKIILKTASIKDVEKLDMTDVYSLYQYYYFDQDKEMISYLTHLLKHMCRVQKYHWEEI